MKAVEKEVLLGNEAIGLGLVESGCEFVASYPGTPSSEILPAVVRFNQRFGLNIYTEWSTNEKVAFDNAFAASLSGKRAACCMKQVGLNVACDSLMSAAYQGVVGGFVVISCDDPGPHSSQTEQDTRLFARFAKVPVFDPSSPEEAREMVGAAFRISERFRIPVLLRPALRVCHAKQDIRFKRIRPHRREANFVRNPQRWAATPRFRYQLHLELNQKINAIARAFERLTRYNFHNLQSKRSRLGIISGGVPFATIMELLEDEGIDNVPVLKIGTPYPLPQGIVSEFMKACSKVLVVEETDTVIELLIRDKRKLMGRLTGHVPLEGELVPEKIHLILSRALEESGIKGMQSAVGGRYGKRLEKLSIPARRPTLCPGCPHRASFYAIRRAFPKAIFTSDIGCYTLGINLGGVDTVLDMGSGITMASGFYHAHRLDRIDRPIIATMGDSTFFHSGTSGLLNAVYNDARFVLLILDNQITAMTGMQPTPGTGARADGSQGRAVPLERIIHGCGVGYLKIHDPYDVKGLISLVKDAHRYTRQPDGGVAVIIARHPCVIAYRDQVKQRPGRVSINQRCEGCGICITTFECPALVMEEKGRAIWIREEICTGCGVCQVSCPKGAIEVA